ncbi:hypothetical protein [Actinoplanes sp. NPDC051494]|uniref:hypothetical protein n=1 Tax=Actinoplanes sp. NPDC051494 TaxID=3363907 RepID=UPI0037ABE625
MVLWIVIGVVVLALIILVVSVLSVLGRLSGLDRAMRRLLQRQEQATRLQADAEALQETILGLQKRAEVAQEQIAVIKAGRGDSNGKHSLQKVTTAW